MRRVVLALALLLAACGDDDVEVTPPPAAGPTSSTAFPGGTTPVSTPTSVLRLLTDVRVGSHPGFDRVVFEFESGVPGYVIEYVERPIKEDGSGNDVKVDGAAVLQVRMTSAMTADLSREELRQTYKGPNRIEGTGKAVKEVVKSGDFEAVLTWVIGVDGKRPFKVYASEDKKLVIEVANA